MNVSKAMRCCLVVACAGFMYSCQKEATPNPRSLTTTIGEPGVSSKADQSMKVNTFKGPEVQMGDGKARSFVTITHTGVPQELGIELTAGALSGLPTSGEETMFVLPLQQKASQVTPFDHIVINWNPQGHPPAPYMLPHFDFHFYRISLADQMAIPPYTPSTAALFDNYPAPGYMPPTYIPTPGGVPQMGKHWVDVTSPELHGATFTKTFIIGTYNGKVTFYEPMITMAYLQSVTSSTTAIPQPSLFSPTGTYYPTSYKVYKDSKGDIFITLADFVWH